MPGRICRPYGGIPGEQVTVAQRPTNTTGLSLNMTLFDGGQRLYGLRTANADIAAAEANRVAVKYNVALNVKQQYYAVLAAIESYDAAKLQMQQAEAQFRTSVAKVRAGVATRSDSLRGVVQVGNAQLALITAQTQKEAADAQLTRLVGSPVPVTADPASVQENMAAHQQRSGSRCSAGASRSRCSEGRYESIESDISAVTDCQLFAQRQRRRPEIRVRK